MMNVQNTIHTSIDDIVDNLLYTVHPVFVNIIVTIKMLPPRHRNTNGVEALFLQESHQFLSCHGLSPCRLIISRCKIGLPSYICIQRVTEIPAQFHILYGTCSALLYIRSIDVHLVASDDIALTEGIAPPRIAWHTTTIPRHEPRPPSTSLPQVSNLREWDVALIYTNATLSQRNELVRIASRDLTELLFVLRGSIAIEVTTYDVYIVVARIPVCINIILVAIAIIVLCCPHPDKVMDTLLTEAVEHIHPQLFIHLCTIIAPPEPRTSPGCSRLQSSIASSLMIWAPYSSDTCILQFQNDIGNLINLVNIPCVFPRTAHQSIGSLEGCLTGSTCHIGRALCLRYIEVPHQRHQSTCVNPICHRCDIVIINPVLTRIRHVNKVIAVHRRILTRGLINLRRFFVVPVDISHNRRDYIHTIVQLQILVQPFSIIIGGIVSKLYVADVCFMVDIKLNTLDIADINTY